MSETKKTNSGFAIPENVREFIVDRAASGTAPCYVYDTAGIEVHCRQFLDIPYERKSIHFATMANIHPEFLGVVCRAGLSAFVNSLEHLRQVLAAGFTGDQIVFTASAMDDEAMTVAQGHGVRVYLDSPSQLDQWRGLFPASPVGLRCNIGDRVEPKDTRAGVFLGIGSRLGFMPEEIEAVAGDPLVTALHLYPGTDIMDVDYFMECYEALWDLAAFFPGLDSLNLGGGFSVSEQGTATFDMKSYGERVSRLMRDRSKALGREIRLVLEPGRIIGCDTGFFACRVTDVKVRGGSQFIGVHASSTQFPRPLFYPESACHPVAILRGKRVTNGQAVPSNVYGCSTYSRDFLAREALMSRAEIGDWVVLGNAGSYCASAHTRFLGFPPAEEIFL
jgi:diaminopimelate decarboxylase